MLSSMLVKRCTWTFQFIERRKYYSYLLKGKQEKHNRGIFFSSMIFAQEKYPYTFPKTVQGYYSIGFSFLLASNPKFFVLHSAESIVQNFFPTMIPAQEYMHPMAQDSISCDSKSYFIGSRKNYYYVLTGKSQEKHNCGIYFL